jgi:ATP-dependent DNA helicase RecG
MKLWVEKAVVKLTLSLNPPSNEPNELDWKGNLSSDTKRITDHLMAFANYPGGGVVVFGVERDANLVSLSNVDLDAIANRVANLGRDSVEPALQIDHQAIMFEGKSILLVHIPESDIKPVHRRGKPFEDTCIRSGGTTRKADRHDVGKMLVNSRTPKWENSHASVLLDEDTLFDRLLIKPIFKMIGRNFPEGQEERLQWMANSALIELHPSGGAYITNLGAICLASDIRNFPALAGKTARVIVYDGFNRVNARHEKEGVRGYAVSFEGLLKYVCEQLPSSEIIQQTLRRTVPLYPELALRELIANALIHQDFTVSGSRPMIEIFTDRIEITNPGKLLPSKSVERIFGTMPESRNEQLARTFRLCNLCEERGSGLIRAGIQTELFGLPPIGFEEGENYFKVTLFAPRSYAQMSLTDRLNACYQHAVLKWCSSEKMTNKSLRERLKMPEKQRSMVSRLIQDAIDADLIAPSDPDNTSKKYTEYVPAFAVNKPTS